MGANCGKNCKSGRKQQEKEIALMRFVRRLRRIFNKNRVVPFSEPGSVSSVISNATVITRDNKNKSRRLSKEERKFQTALIKPYIDLNSTPLLDVEFNNDDMQGKGGELKEANKRETIIDIKTYHAKFEKDVDELLACTNETPNRSRRPKAAKGVRTCMTVMLAANLNIDIILPGEVFPSLNTSTVSRPQLTAPELPTKEKVYLDNWIEHQNKKDNLKK